MYLGEIWKVEATLSSSAEQTRRLHAGLHIPPLVTGLGTVAGGGCRDLSSLLSGGSSFESSESSCNLKASDAIPPPPTFTTASPPVMSTKYVYGHPS